MPSISKGFEYKQVGTSEPRDSDNLITLLVTFFFRDLCFDKKYLIILALFADPPPKPPDTGIFFSSLI